jgi:glycosyltransferase involved in cell wall biosynthesis
MALDHLVPTVDDPTQWVPSQVAHIARDPLDPRFDDRAFLRALALWPRISAGVPDAELCVVGAKKPNAPEPTYPAGVRDLGFVDDLHGFLGTCRALMAPITTGGGVRVKILDAARIGLPVVGTEAAVGSLGSIFALDVAGDDDAFVEACRRMLTDRAAAVSAGRAIYQANERHWRDGAVRAAVNALIQGDPDDSATRP